MGGSSEDGGAQEPFDDGAKEPCRGEKAGGRIRRRPQLLTRPMLLIGLLWSLQRAGVPSEEVVVHSSNEKDAALSVVDGGF